MTKNPWNQNSNTLSIPNKYFVFPYSNDITEETIEDLDDKFNPLEFLKEEPMDIDDEPTEQIEISNVISKVNIV